ncbi:MAG: threonyl-tRNA synthetase editing domain-containing protein [Candidatus Hydrothermarchaeota archaeon]
MRFLFVHTDFTEIENKRVTNALTVMITECDLEHELKSVEGAVKEIEDVASKVKTKNIVLYPSSPFKNCESCFVDEAACFLEKLQDSLEKKGYNVTSGSLMCRNLALRSKGHPLSVLSREIKAN